MSLGIRQYSPRLEMLRSLLPGELNSTLPPGPAARCSFQGSFPWPRQKRLVQLLRRVLLSDAALHSPGRKAAAQ